MTPQKSGRFVKLPIEIEAMQYDGTSEGLQELKDWGAPVQPRLDGTRNLLVQTAEGHHTVNIHDWIIRGIDGEYYTCKPGIFKRTYKTAV